MSVINSNEICARSSVGRCTALLRRGSWVRVPVGVQFFIKWVLSFKRAKQQTPHLHDESSNLSGPAINQRGLDDEVNFYSKVTILGYKSCINLYNIHGRKDLRSTINDLCVVDLYREVSSQSYTLTLTT